jgi:hypothetical protein
MYIDMLMLVKVMGVLVLFAIVMSLARRIK